MPLPLGFVPPCLPTKAPQPPSGEAWLHEIKHDGFRVIARKDGDLDLTYRFPLIVEALARLRSRSVIIDGGRCSRQSIPIGFATRRHIRGSDAPDPEAHRIDWEARQVSVIDIHNLHDRAKRFVVGVVVKTAVRIKGGDPLSPPTGFSGPPRAQQICAARWLAKAREVLDVHDRGGRRLAPAIDRIWEDSIAATRADLRERLRRASEDESGYVPWLRAVVRGLEHRDERRTGL